MFQKVVFFGLATIILLLIGFKSDVDATGKTWTEEEITYQSDGIQMSGTVLTPKKPGKHPAIVFVGGSNQEERENLRQDAEVFVKAGFTTLIYDKRGNDPSYSQLAADALAGVQALQKRNDVQANQVGLWGFSEGGWVAPLAASLSDQVAFLIVVGAPAVKPIQQQAWHLENRFRYHQMTSGSFLEAMTHKGARFVLASGMFPEGTYDPLPVLAKVKQPVLAIWGEADRMSPPVESAKLFQQILEKNNNKYYSIQFLANAEHAAHTFKQAGFQRLPAFAADYEQTVVNWLQQVTDGNPPKQQHNGDLPAQWSFSDSTVTTLHWYDSLWLHLSVLVLCVLAFSSYLLYPIFSRKQQKTTMPWWGSCLSLTGIIGSLGFVSYFIYIWGMNGAKSSPLLVIADRPLIWLLIQLCTWIATLLTLCLVVWGWSKYRFDGKMKIARFYLLLIASLVFILWGVYWNLLLLS